MYIESIRIKKFRCFRDAEIDFSYNGRIIGEKLPKPKLPNINLLLGNNGSGKTTLLKAIALTALGPAIADSGIFSYRLIRREPEQEPSENDAAVLGAAYKAHSQDLAPSDIIESEIEITRKGDLERLRWSRKDEEPWHPIFSERSDAFFFVGYGATRRVEKRNRVDAASRKQSYFVRAQRIQSLFEETYSLMPLSVWLPGFEKEYPDRYEQILELVNRLLERSRYRFTGKLEDNEYVFERGGLQVPFPALSDGYRAYLGWIGDLLYHICMTCSPNSNLLEHHGIVMVDEIDLHIHPKWQLTILPVLAKALPNIQFIVTSHSPLVVGSLEWMNIILMTQKTKESSKLGHIAEGIHGLDADQILLTDFFGMETTRAPSKESQLARLTKKAREGDVAAAEPDDFSREVPPKDSIPPFSTP